ncbi:unnamed protein product, partial [Laminaria digitata]
CRAAAEGGHLHVLEWARANNCPGDENTCYTAAWRGHFKLFQWARENCCPWDDRTCRSAAGAGHFSALQWVQGNDCPWCGDTCTSAAALLNWHVGIIQWARANGWGQGTSLHAPSLLVKGTWTFFSGHVQTATPGTGI